MEINAPTINEPRLKDLPEVTIIPPAEIIAPTTLGELPFGFVPLIEMPCVVARNESSGVGAEMFNVDPQGSMVLCDHAPVVVVAVDGDSIAQEIAEATNTDTDKENIEEMIPKAETPFQLLNQLQRTSDDEGEVVKKENREKDNKKDTDVKQNVDLNLVTEANNNGFIAEVLPCPPLDTLAKTPIGSLGKGGLARIKGWIRDETDGTCKTVWEGLNPLEIAGNYAPQPTVLVNTSAIAIGSVVAVTAIGQPVAKFLQKQVKGQVKSFSKKITKKLLALRGKKPKVLSLSQRRKDQRKNSQK